MARLEVVLVLDEDLVGLPDLGDLGDGAGLLQAVLRHGGQAAGVPEGGEAEVKGEEEGGASRHKEVRQVIVTEAGNL